MFIKLWTLCLRLQYPASDLKSVIDKTQIPLNMPLYLDVLSLFQEAIGGGGDVTGSDKVAFYEGFVLEVLRMYGFQRLKEYNHITFEQELRQLYSLITFKDKGTGEVRFRSKEYIKMVMASRNNSKKVSNQTSV